MSCWRLGAVTAIALLLAAAPAAAQSGPETDARTAGTVEVQATGADLGPGPRRTPVVPSVEPRLDTEAGTSDQNRLDSLTISLSGTAVVVLLIVLLILVID